MMKRNSDTPEVGSGLLADWADRVLPSRPVLLCLFAVLLAFKLAYFFAMPPLADEAYYWLWGQNPALSYFDHPPLLAWVQYLSSVLFGWSVYAARLVTLVTMGASAWIIWYWSKKLAPEKSVDVFLAAVFAVMMTPLIMRFQSVPIQDCLLIAFAMGAMHFLALFTAKWRAGTHKWSYYFAACLCIGFAGLSKYNGVFLAVGVAIAAFVTPMGRQWLKRINFWLGGLMVAVMQAPILVWNLQNDWPSFRYNLQDRIGQSMGGGFLDNVLFFVINSFVMLGPVFFIALVRLVMPSKDQKLGDYAQVARWVAVASTLAFVVLSFSNTVLPYWNMAAWAVVLPVMIFLIRSKLEYYIHAAFCVFIGGWLMVSYGLYPLHKRNGEDIRDVDISYGLEQIAQEVAQQEEQLGVDFVVTTDYRTASMLALTRGADDVYKMGLRGDQFDFWFDQKGLKGKTALVLADDFLPVSEVVEGVFEKVTFVREIKVEKFGYDIHTYQLYLAENYSGEGPH